MKMVNELDCELAGDDAQEIYILSTEFWLDQEGRTINELEGREPVSEPYHYQEWDYQVQLYRPDWTTVIERRQERGDPELMDGILTKYKPVVSRIRHLIDAMQPQGIVRRRGYEEGEETGPERRRARHDRHPPRRHARSAHQHPHRPPYPRPRRSLVLMDLSAVHQ